MSHDVVFISGLCGFSRKDLQCNIFAVDQRVLRKPNGRGISMPKFDNYNICILVEFVANECRVIASGTVAVHIFKVTTFLKQSKFLLKDEVRYRV